MSILMLNFCLLVDLFPAKYVESNERNYTKQRKASDIVYSKLKEGVVYVIAQSWLERAEIYKLFGGSPEQVDYSEKSKQESYMWESRGIGNHKFGVMKLDSGKPNGYIIGKRWMEVTVKMWLEDIKDGILFEWELYHEKKYPIWWLNEIFK